MKLICIDDITDILGFGNGIKELTFGKEYEIQTVYNPKNSFGLKGRLYVSLINDQGFSNDYLFDRFVTLEIFREMKLNKLGI